MSIAVDIKYAALIGPHLRNFTRKPNNSFNFSCPFCGDSAKNKRKARGYLFVKNDGLRFVCFNCNEPKSFSQLIATVDESLYSDYRLEQFSHANPEMSRAEIAPTKTVASIDRQLIKLTDLPQDHAARTYIDQRMIPATAQQTLYYTDTFFRWAASIRPDAMPPAEYDEPRVVIPLIDKKNSVLGYQGRTLAPKSAAKYITVLYDENSTKVYGLDRVNINRTVICLEGPFNAMFLSNAIASAGGRIDSAVSQVQISKDRAIIVYDNEPRNKHTVAKMLKAVDNGYRVCVWPQSIADNDINAMVLSGLSPEKIEQTINDNAFVGLEARLQIAQWAKTENRYG